jgi:hypothetical protein
VLLFSYQEKGLVNVMLVVHHKLQMSHVIMAGTSAGETKVCHLYR